MSIEDSEYTTRLRALDSAALSDALDSMGIHCQCVGLLPVGPAGPFAGRAFTVRMLPVGATGRSVGDFIDEVPAGSVVVIDNYGRLDVTVWGDLLTTVATRNGVAGVVIDGVCRDTGAIHELNLPVYSRSRTMRTGKDRVAAEEYRVPVQAATVRVEQDDWVFGDIDGVVIVPGGLIDEVLDKAEAISAAEEDIRGAISGGSRLDEARVRSGYHALQSVEG